MLILVTPRLSCAFCSSYGSDIASWDAATCDQRGGEYWDTLYSLPTLAADSPRHTILKRFECCLNVLIGAPSRKVWWIPNCNLIEVPHHGSPVFTHGRYSDIPYGISGRQDATVQTIRLCLLHGEGELVVNVGYLEKKL